MLNTVTYTGKKLLPLYPSGTAPTPTMPMILAQGTYKAGQAVEMSATPGIYQALTADANAVALLEYDVVVDANGRHFMGAQASDETGVGDTYTSAYLPGGALSFKTADLAKDNAGTAITAAIVTALKGVLVSGTAADGIIQF
jgi:hypothetical protein